MDCGTDALDGQPRWEPDEPIVAVIPHPGVRGVEAPRPGDGSDWRLPRGAPGNERGVRAALEVLPLRLALARFWHGEHHLVPYVLHGPDGRPCAWGSDADGVGAALGPGVVLDPRQDYARGWQPRLNKSSLPWLRAQGYAALLHVFAADVDNDPHVPWDEASLARFYAEVLPHPALRGCVVYLTKRGYRVVRVLAVPVSAEDAEPLIDAWLKSLRAAGIPADMRCGDWTRLFRLPRTLRGGERSDFGLLCDDAEPFDPYALPVAPDAPPVPRAARADRAARPDAPPRPSRPRRERPVAVADALPAWWTDRASGIAAAIQATVRGGRFHDCYLALAGAMLTRGVPPEFVPEFVRQVALAAGSSKPDTHHQGGATTVAKREADRPFRGWKHLKTHFPEVARALRAVTVAAPPSDDAAPPEPGADADDDVRFGADVGADWRAAFRPPVVTLAEAREAMRSAFLYPPPGISAVHSDCGVGKSHAAMEAAVERARARPWQRGARRAPLESKTALLFDKNALAIQQLEVARAAGAPARRLFGAASLLDEEGDAVCRFPAAARALAGGGQSVRLTLCEGGGGPRAYACPHQTGCAAYRGEAGAPAAQVVLSTHALTRKAADAVGATGVLVVDEPRDYLSTASFEVRELADALEALDRFYTARYAAAMRPALVAALVWTRSLGTADARLGREVLAEAADALDGAELARALAAVGEPPSGDPVADAARAAAAAPEPARRSQAPSLDARTVARLRFEPATADAAGATSRALAAVHRLVTSPERVTARVTSTHDGERRVLHVSAPSPEVVAALRHPGPVVFSDATLDTHREVLEKLLSYPLAAADGRLVRARVADAAPVARVHLRTTKATRRRWFDHGRPAWTSGIAHYLGLALAFAAEDPSARELCLVTFRSLFLVLQAVVDPRQTASMGQRWFRAGLPMRDWYAGVAALRPAAAAWPHRWVLGYYGATRGMNHAMGADALVTLGDPWVDLAHVRHEAAYLGLSDWEARALGKLRSELEQCHGRGRAPCRTTPLRALHVGAVLPGGWAWEQPDVEVRTPPRGTWVERSLSAEEFSSLVGASSLNQRDVGKMIGRSQTTVRKYMAGEASISPAMACIILSSFEDHFKKTTDPDING